MEKSCLIVFTGGKGIDVTFTGEWIRADLDRAHVALFRELPKHVVARRRALEKEKENG